MTRIVLIASLFAFSSVAAVNHASAQGSYQGCEAVARDRCTMFECLGKCAGALDQATYASCLNHCDSARSYCLASVRRECESQRR
jgi:hypothetical protein